MTLTERIKSLSKKANIAIGVIAVVVIAAVAAGIIVFARSSYLANTMRLLRIEGTVNIEDSKGGSKPVSDYVRFKSRTCFRRARQRQGSHAPERQQG